MSISLKKPLSVFFACLLAFSLAGIAPTQAFSEDKTRTAPTDITIEDSTSIEEPEVSREQDVPVYEDPSMNPPPSEAPAVGPDVSTLGVDPLATDITTQLELQEALIQAVDGDVIELTQNIVIDGNGMVYNASTSSWTAASDVPITIPSSFTNITIKGNGHRIELADGYTGLHFNAEPYTWNARTVTLSDLKLIGHNEGIDPDTALDQRLPGGGMHLDGNQTTLVWDNVTMSGVHGIGTGGGLVNYGAKAKLNNCTITDVSATGNGGFYTSSASGNSYGGSLIMSGGTVTGARSGGNGGFALLSGGSHTLTGVTFTDCYGAGDGGVLSNAAGDSIYNIDGCTFINNRSGAGGGAVYSQAGGSTYTNCTFTNNKAGVLVDEWFPIGGAIYQSAASPYGYSTVDGCVFDGNEAESGGAIYGQGFNFIDVTFTNNSATRGSGGAIYCNPYTWYTINGAYFEGNYASTGQLNWDLDNPRSWIESGLRFSELAAHYNANVSGVTNLTAQAANAAVPPTNCANNYDVATYPFTTYFVAGTDATWSDTGTSAQRTLNVSTQTVFDILSSRNISLVHENGKRLLGWSFPIGQFTVNGNPATFEGYGDDPYIISSGVNDALLRAQGYTDSEIVDGSTYYVQGNYHFLFPVWEDQVTLVYHPSDSTSLNDPDGPHGMLTETTAKTLAELGGNLSAPDGQVLAGWALTETEVDGETIYRPGDDIMLQTDDLADGEVHLYARYIAAPASVELSVARLYGDHRYSTSKQVSVYERGAEDTVILASGDDGHFPDALAASSLSGHLGNAPIVLSPTDYLSEDSATSITDLQASKVYLIGDKYAISESVEESVRALPCVTEVERIGGADRQETAELINQAIDGYRNTTAIIARSDDFPDSLSISAWASATMSPIFLTEFGQSGLTAETKAALASEGYERIIVLGDENAIPASVEAEARVAAGLSSSDVVRLGGIDRCETSKLVAQWTTDDSRTDFERLCWEKPAIARADKHSDSLTGGALQGRDRSPILLTYGTEPNMHTLPYCASKDGMITEIRFFGDENAISYVTTREYVKGLTWDTVCWKPHDGVAIDLS